MTSDNTFSPIKSALVTGATGLLGNNLVRLLVSRGVHVKALVRPREKAARQLAGLPVEIVVDEMTNVSGFANDLNGVDVIFHTAAYFRDNYKGGKHWKQLFATNVLGTAHLFSEAYKAGVRRIVHTSSVAVLSGAPVKMIDETMRRNPEEADDYYRSKILADRKVDAFLETHADMWACMVLPGWMVGPGDMGPTSSGQVILDFLHRKMPGIPPATFSVVDARDVAEAMWLAATQKGRRGERYLAAGRHMSMGDLFQKLEQISGIAAPRWNVPLPVLYAMAAANEIWAGIAKRPALISLATVRLMGQERERTRFNHAKSERELGIQFRPVEETLSDTMRWYQQNGWLETPALKKNPLHAAGQRT
jgi:nucleoside-diphosphate-sugar epimerase